MDKFKGKLSQFGATIQGFFRKRYTQFKKYIHYYSGEERKFSRLTNCGILFENKYV